MSKTVVKATAKAVVKTAPRANKALIDGLTGVLADTFVLFVNTQACHWNVAGPHFAALHELFGTQYEELHDAVDELAERLRALGHLAPVGVAALKGASSLKDGLGNGFAEEMIEALLAAHTQLIANLQLTIELADDVDDNATEDLLIGRLQAHQKTAWMLRALLEK